MNRALELAELFERISRHDQGDVPLAQLWAIEFNAKKDSDFFHCLACVSDKIETLKVDIKVAEANDRAKKLGEGAVLQLAQFCSIPEVFKLKRNNLLNLQPQIDMLYIISDSLPPYLVPDINPLTVDDIKKKIVALISDVCSSDLDASFANLLVSSLETLVLSIDAYKSLGPDGAAKVFGIAAAEIARLGGTEVAQSKAAKSKIARAKSLCKSVGGAIIFVGAVVGGAHSVIEDGKSILGIEDQATTTSTGNAPEDSDNNG